MDHVGIDVHKAAPGGAGSRGHRRRPGLRADVRDAEAPREDGRAGCASAAITETCRPGSGRATGTRARPGLTDEGGEDSIGAGGALATGGPRESRGRRLGVRDGDGERRDEQPFHGESPAHLGVD